MLLVYDLLWNQERYGVNVVQPDPNFHVYI